jgi:hypothetical protein
MSNDSELPYWVEGRPKPAEQSQMDKALFYGIEPQYFSIMRIPLLRGRLLDARDNESGACVMDIDDEFGVKSAFQLVPEDRGHVTAETFAGIRRRGFEANVHDLNHDGRLFSRRDLFDARITEINRYAREYGSRGFRSGAMYRRQEWFDAFEFDYDMSVPSVAHLEPQRGGCCTVMPYFVGRVLEVPLTMAQDYTVLHILGKYSTDLWRQQAELILRRHGLISVIVHPDYLVGDDEARAVYRQLLTYLTGLVKDRGAWLALPGEVEAWWRNRRQMTVVERDGQWVVEGPDGQRARVAVARLDGDAVVYDIQGR